MRRRVRVKRKKSKKFFSIFNVVILFSSILVGFFTAKTSSAVLDIQHQISSQRRGSIFSNVARIAEAFEVYNVKRFPGQ